ncbi:hypothetical protein CJF42_25130 [Pseudoalteromonas sp. NBT06-2]|uniref:hypothetical protein n=1 Tax=Pseudoalteromonas sp. NBT06-2 TaxID=2025950 RepID=UPI000BA5758A|nr:hypothetical protein [Pseudoalteromonas sp. NBT06-2]PAJ71731.1 hypothetical protein CJF42_25130 [Pseudoalteromonas sp. NBT06-2]
MDKLALLTKLKDLNREFSFTKNDDGYEFSVTISLNTIIQLTDCIDHGIPISAFLLNEMYIELADLSDNIGSTVKIELSSKGLKQKKLTIFNEWTDFLSFKPNLLHPPESFIILQEEIVHPSNSIDGKLKHFFDISNFLHLLNDNADHSTKVTSKVIDELVFLHKSRLDIPIILPIDCLDDALDGYSIVDSLFKDDSHTEQKSSIFKEVMYGLLINIPMKERLGYLLLNFGEFSKRFNENYQLFVSEFSFDDVRKEYEENKRDYLTKLNDIFSSVQTKMLGIPISLAIASLKMSSVVDGISFWTNFLLAISITIYSIMMFMLIANQKHTLSAVKSEYKSQMTRLKHQYSEQYESIKKIQTELDTRHDFQKSCLNWFYVMSAALFILILALFTWNLPWKSILGLA